MTHTHDAEQHDVDRADGLGSQNVTFVESIYARYLDDPHAVSADWKHYFDQSFNGQRTSQPSVRRVSHPERERSRYPETEHPSQTTDGDGFELAVLQERVDQLIRNYRVRGHIIAEIDPLGQPRPRPVELDPGYYGFTPGDDDRRFAITLADREEILPFREILSRLRNTYCRFIGVQFMHIDDLGVRQWLQERMESTQNHVELSRVEQLRILTRLTDAVVFEEFIQKKYLGAKSFSLEGAESLIPLLDLAIEKAGEQDIDEIVMGMAHRGRLNVLANIIGKHPRQIFREFEDRDPELHIGGGDVKYHLGYSGEWTTDAGKTIHISLCFNPSHLEFVNPVALGRMRAKQDRFGDIDRRRGVAILIHGDAAFAGEGVIQESLNLSELPAYTTGGTIHVIVNNQLGFTTGPVQGRSSVYATDVAKMLQIPIFHVNGEDPEAVAQVVRLAMDFRREFARDVVIDMYGYRRHGHNEGDEPSFTQPMLYQAINEKASVRISYRDHLVSLGGVAPEEADEIADERRELLEQELSVARSDDYVPQKNALGGIWSGYTGGPERDAADVETGVAKEKLTSLLETMTRPPDDFHPHKKIVRGLELRLEMAGEKRPLDWSAAEALALASLAAEGVRVRLTGQDTERGTFSQRHAVLHDAQDGHTYVPLQHLVDGQATVEICNSPLSETGVLAFEYGYSLDCPDGLVMWEAQFGDFVNAGQVIVDQFMTSAEDKWNRLSGLVLLLPHGFEGQGPEHSSARLERFLLLAAEDNIQVVNLTTPAQYFHCLRRQVLRKWRKPLIVMTPKSLLRHRDAVSTLEDCAARTFERVIPDDRPKRGENIERVLLCSGKIYYELSAAREKLKRNDVAVIRVEQLYPLPEQELRKSLEEVSDGTKVFWVQEEPRNMGAWWFMHAHFGHNLFERFPFDVVARAPSASPATGSKTSHEMEQNQILDEAFGGS
ncbi:MAG: 2-oxoglutarate dehydrogenase E1 component [Planctomycetaceae bacterium]